MVHASLLQYLLSGTIVEVKLGVIISTKIQISMRTLDDTGMIPKPVVPHDAIVV